MGIYTVRTVAGRENSVMTRIQEKVKEGKIKAMVHPEKLRGYVIIEGDKDKIKDTVKGLRHAKGMIEKEGSIDEIKHLIESRKIEINLNKGDIVEVVGGPFKGQKGKITKVDKTKAEATLEMMEVSVPIPVTIGVDSLRVLERREE